MVVAPWRRERGEPEVFASSFRDEGRFIDCWCSRHRMHPDPLECRTVVIQIGVHKDAAWWRAGMLDGDPHAHLAALLNLDVGSHSDGVLDLQPITVQQE